MKTCPRCNAKNDADARFCTVCGLPIDQASESAVKPLQTPVTAFDEQNPVPTNFSSSDTSEASSFSSASYDSPTEPRRFGSFPKGALVENRTPKTKSVLFLENSSLRKFGRLLFVFGILCAAALIALPFVGKFAGIKIAFWEGILVFPCLLALGFGIIFLRAEKKYLKKLPYSTEHSVAVYTFEENCFRYELFENGFRLAISEVPYSFISQVSETTEFITLQTIDASSYSLFKAAFTVGTAEQLLALLRSKCRAGTLIENPRRRS